MFNYALNVKKNIYLHICNKLTIDWIRFGKKMRRAAHNYPVCTIILMLCAFLSASAQNRVVRIDSCFQIHYPLSRVHVLEGYLNNAENIALIRQYLKSSPRIDSLTIYSFSSPEGSYTFNEHLSRQRGESAKRFLLSMLPEGCCLPDSLIVLFPQAENWEGLRNEIAKDYPYEDKEEILAILGSGLSASEKKNRLKAVSHGQAWLHLLRDYMPRLRYATWRLYLMPPPAQPSLAFKLQQMPFKASMPSEWPSLSVFTPERTEYKHFPLALKTNLLYDAVTALNVEVEIPIGHRWSIAIEDVFPWWEKDNKYCFQLWEMGVEGRYWFHRTDARKHLTGTFGGVYTMSGMYDLQNDRKFNYQGEFWSAGVTVGYAYKLSRLFNLELSASLGYLSTHYRHYFPTDDYDILVKDKYEFGRYNYVGPTKLKVALVMPIELKFKRKGGAL